MDDQATRGFQWWNPLDYWRVAWLLTRMILHRPYQAKR